MSAYFNILNEIKPVQLIAVSKTKPIEDIQALYDLGQRDFGENKVQEMVEKYNALPKDIQWHLIGHLQTNKLKYIASFVHLIHSVDSLKLLFEIKKHAQASNRNIAVLLQIHIAAEETKFGLSNKELFEIMEYYDADADLKKYITIAGLMGMATHTSDEQVIENEFKELKALFQFCKKTYRLADPQFKEISMGMSSDYKIAIREGSTMVRIGSLLFGQRS